MTTVVYIISHRGQHQQQFYTSSLTMVSTNNSCIHHLSPRSAPTTTVVYTISHHGQHQRQQLYTSSITMVSNNDDSCIHHLSPRSATTTTVLYIIYHHGQQQRQQSASVMQGNPIIPAPSQRQRPQVYTSSLTIVINNDNNNLMHPSSVILVSNNDNCLVHHLSPWSATATPALYII